MTDNFQETIDNLNEKLKESENKLQSILDLVQKTFTGDSSAAQELSEIIGVPAPILCSEEEELSKKTHNVDKTSYSESKKRLTSRMNFLNQVMDDHDTLMKPNVQKIVRYKNNTAPKNLLKSRVRSADRTSKLSEHILFNPYTWNINDHVDYNDTNLYKTEFSNTPNICLTKAVSNKSLKLRPQTRPSNLSDIKVDQLLANSENRRAIKSGITPESRDYKFTYENDFNVEKPPKPKRPTSSVSNKRIVSGRANRRSNLTTPFHTLNLQPMDDPNDNTEKMLDAMEKRFKLSTIDLQRRLGIPEAAWVGP